MPCVDFLSTKLDFALLKLTKTHCVCEVKEMCCMAFLGQGDVTKKYYDLFNHNYNPQSKLKSLFSILKCLVDLFEEVK